MQTDTCRLILSAYYATISKNFFAAKMGGARQLSKASLSKVLL